MFFKPKTTGLVTRSLKSFSATTSLYPLKELPATVGVSLSMHQCLTYFALLSGKQLHEYVYVGSTLLNTKVQSKT